MFGNLYILSVSDPCCFTEVTLNKFFSTSGNYTTLLLHAKKLGEHVLRKLKHP